MENSSKRELGSREDSQGDADSTETLKALESVVDEAAEVGRATIESYVPYRARDLGTWLTLKNLIAESPNEQIVQNYLGTSDPNIRNMCWAEIKRRKRREARIMKSASLFEEIVDAPSSSKFNAIKGGANAS